MYDRYKRCLFCAGLLLSFCLALQAQGKGFRRVATNDCGVENAQPFLIKGENYTLPQSFSGSKEAKTINFGGTVIYAFDALEDVNPRQWGVVFEVPVSFDKTFWCRDGLWSVYPSDHISRPVGEACLFYEGLPEKVDPRTEPAWSWSMDYNELGSNDFRSTRRNIWYAGLKDMNGNKITVPSNGQQHWRSWLEKDRIRFLVAGFVTAGNEIFLSTYSDPYRKPVRKGERIGGEIIVRVE